MKQCIRTAVILIATIWGHVAWAQTWVQIEARPNQTLGLERAAEYAARLPDVNGFRLASGWFAIALGPYSEAEALATLGQLRASRAIPSDSFISDGGNFIDRFFGSDSAPRAAAQPAEPLPPLEPGEDRELIQIALRWEGFYNSIIDASFGPGTRRAMAGWQEANRYEPTGVLTTRQRRELVEAYTQALTSLNMQPVSDPVSSVVMQASLANVDSVMVAGEFHKRHGRLLADVADGLRELEASGHRIYAELQTRQQHEETAR